MGHLSPLEGTEQEPTEDRLSKYTKVVHALATWTLLHIASVLHAEEPQSPTPDATIATWVKGMDDDAFLVRENASAQSSTALWEGYDMHTEDPDVLLKRIKNVPPLSPKKEHSAEHRKRVDALEAALEHWRYDIPRALPAKGEVSGNVALQLAQRTASLPMQIVETRLDTLANTPVRLPKEWNKRLLTRTVLKLCNASDTVPMMLPDASLYLRPRRDGEYAGCTDDLLYTSYWDSFLETEAIELFFEPGRGTILALCGDDGNYMYSIEPLDMFALAALREKETLPRVRVIAPELGRPDWKVDRVLPNVHRSINMQLGSHIDAIVADMPISADVPIGGQKEEIGFQQIAAHNAVLDERGPWWLMPCTISIVTTPELSRVPHWKTLAHAVVNANRYVAYSEDGAEMPVTVAEKVSKKGSIEITLATRALPARMTVHSYGRIGPKHLKAPTPLFTLPEQPVSR